MALIKRLCLLGLICLCPLAQAAEAPEKPSAEQPVIINGDTVEYSTDQKKASASGNVVVNYGKTRLSCKKMSVDTTTKDVVAEGDVRIDDPMLTVTGDKVAYNLRTKSGSVDNAHFFSPPYYGSCRQLQMLNPEEFIALDGYATTCSLDRPEYRIASRKIRVLVGDKIQTRSTTLKLRGMPLAYLPFYSHSLKDPLMHVQLRPGHSKDWGEYLLSAWRYNLADRVSGRIYADYRSELGFAAGFGSNIYGGEYGDADLKYYHAQERPRSYLEDQPAEFERSLVRLRHTWDIDDSTRLTNEYYRITDSKRILLGAEHNLLKDYFYREYERDAQPLSYSQLHHSFDYSSADVLVQKRTNRWYSQLEKLPEARYDLPNIQLGETPFYFSDSTLAGSYNYKYPVPSPSTADISVSRLDTTNKISLPSRISFVNVTPFVGMRQTVYDRDVNGDSMLDSPRSVFLTGVDASTKFYRLFDVQTDAFGLDINGLRHIITPTIGYAYNPEPTELASRLKQIDAVDGLTRSNQANLALLQTLQTKRDGVKVDLLTFEVSSPYLFKPKNNGGSRLGDILFDLETRPYKRFYTNTDAAFDHRADYFKNANFDLNYEFAVDRSVTFGQRYQRKGGNELTFASTWRFNPKWKFGIYERYQLKPSSTVKRGSAEQQYTLTRDLHCWLLDMVYSVTDDSGSSVWLVFTLKAFPETSFQVEKTTDRPARGSSY